MFTKSALANLHLDSHACLDLLLDHAAASPQNIFTQPVEGFGHPSVSRQLTHVIACEMNWVGGMAARPWTDRPLVELTTISDVRAVKAQTIERTIAYLDSLGEVELNRTLDPVPAAWIGPPRSPGFILCHIVTHAFHHKGQITAMFRLLGHPVGDTDLQRA